MKAIAFNKVGVPEEVLAVIEKEKPVPIIEGAGAGVSIPIGSLVAFFHRHSWAE